MTNGTQNYEDNVLKLMPIKPKSLQQVIEFKMAELGMNQSKLPEELGIGALKLSQILSFKCEPYVDFFISKKTD